MSRINMTRSGGLEFKILVIGEDGVGKTSLIRRFTLNQFDNNPDHEGEYCSTELNLFGAPVKLQIQDLVGAVWETTASYYLRDNDGILMVLDTSLKIKTKPYIDYWLEPIQKFRADIPYIVIGNKSDLKVQVNIKKIAQYIAHIGSNFIQTSAFTGDNVSYAFKLITSEIVKKKAAAKKSDEVTRAWG